MNSNRILIIGMIILIIVVYKVCIGFKYARIENMGIYRCILTFLPIFMIMIISSNDRAREQNDYKKCLKLQEKIFIQEEVVEDVKLKLDLEKSNKHLERKYIEEKQELNKYIKKYNQEVNKYNSEHNSMFSPELTTYHN